MNQLLHLFPVLAAGSLAGAGLFGKVMPQRVPRRFFPNIAGLAALFVVLSVAGPSVHSGLWLTDGLSLTVATTVALITAAVLRFCLRHLHGDAAQTDLMAQVSLVSCSVLVFLLSGHLALTWVSWVAAGLLVHSLLTLDRSRPDAVFIARKKFLFGRISDVLLGVAFVLMYRAHGSAEVAEILATPGKTPASAVALIAFAAVIRSAQAPFHTWLPETMEAPAPVSALMHAGIVNAGGFLVIRFAPVMATYPAALHALAVTGGLTAIYGAVCMTAQPEAKRTLAYSTVAQMGFLIFTCGIGAFGAATIHLVAHAIYKADAFLRAGEAGRAPSRAAVKIPVTRVFGGLILAGIPALLIVMRYKPDSADTLLILVSAIALAYGAARSSSSPAGFGLLPGALATGLLLTASWAVLHGFGAALVAKTDYTPPPGLLIALGGIPLLLLTFQTTLVGRRFAGFKAALNAHALHGFYLSTVISKRLSWLAPKPFPKR